MGDGRCEGCGECAGVVREGGGCEQGPSHVLHPGEEMKQAVLQHCRRMHAIDPAYAVWAFDRYAALLPWIGLERKKR